jgi:hypothetical protein
MKKILTAITLITILLTTTTFTYAGSEPQNTKEISAQVSVAKPKFPKVRRTSDTSHQINWKKVSGVNGYVIYRYNKSKKKYARVKTTNNITSTKWTDRKLEKDKTYKYRLRSYKRVNGKKVYSGYTYSISAKTYSKSAKKVNAGSINAKSSITIGLVGKTSVKVKIKPSKFGNAKKKSVISKSIRFVSANSKIVVDGKKGKLSPRKPGTTNVYAIAHNGTLKKIKVKVVDYAKPAVWNNLNKVDEEARVILVEQSDDIKEIASYFSTHPKSQNTILYLDEYGKLVNEDGVALGTIENTVKKFLTNCDYYVHISVSNDGITFKLYLGTAEKQYTESIFYQYNLDMSENEANSYQLVKLAKQWFYELFLPI